MDELNNNETPQGEDETQEKKMSEGREWYVIHCYSISIL